MRPAIDVTLTIAPARRSRREGSTACIMRTAPKTLVSNRARISSMGISSTAADEAMPALFTSTSTGPTCATAWRTDSSRSTSSAIGVRDSPSATARCNPSDAAGLRAPA